MVRGAVRGRSRGRVGRLIIVNDSINDGERKAKPPGGSLVTHLAVFLNHMRGGDFSAVFQINRIGEYNPGKGQGKGQNREESKGTRRGKPHNVILSRRVPGWRSRFPLDAQSCYSRGAAKS
jgi:hypothetical protein